MTGPVSLAIVKEVSDWCRLRISPMKTLKMGFRLRELVALKKRPPMGSARAFKSEDQMPQARQRVVNVRADLLRSSNNPAKVTKAG